jgi:hypothetical protein
MPIDFAAIAAEFGDRLEHQTHPLEQVFDHLEDAVKKLVEESERAERATRAYPIFRYRDGALAVHVDPIGAEPLPSAPPRGFVEGLASGGREFLAGIGWTGTAVRQELVVPRLLGLTGDALQVVVDSIDRFARPTPAMFDPRRRRLSDALGLLVLGYNSLLGPGVREQLLGGARGAAGLRQTYRETERMLFADSSETPAGGAAPALGTVDRLVAGFEGGAEYLLEAVVLLPILGEALAVVLHDGALEAKRAILTELGGVEAKAHELRAGALEGLIEAADLGGVAAEWLFAARTVILIDVDVLTTVVPSLLDSFLTGVRAFAEGVTEWGRWVTDVMEAIRSTVDELMSFDLLGFAIRLIIPRWALRILPSLPKVTVDDLISFLIGEAALDIRDTILSFLGAASDALWLAGADDLRAKVDDLAAIVGIVLTPTPFAMPPDVMPTTPLAGFPDVYEAFFGGGRAATFLAAIDRFGVESRAGIRTALGGAQTALASLGTTFAAEADRAATMGSVAEMRRMAGHAGETAERVFGPEAARVREQMAARRPDQLAAAFESAITSGGFALIGNAIPAYVVQMRRFWEQRRPPVEHPTSPHILARHGRLGAVRVPRIEVRAPGRTPNRELAAAVSARFHDAIGDAYLSGRHEFERLREPAARRPVRRSPTSTRAHAALGAEHGR